MSDYFTSKEYLEFEADAKIQVSELDSWFEAHPLCEVKTIEDNRVYWHNQIKRCCLRDLNPNHGMSYYNLQQMKICIECLKHSLTISPEAFNRWKEYWWCFQMDVVGEAHCLLGHQYYLKMNMSSEDKKEELEETIELGYQYHEIK